MITLNTIKQNNINNKEIGFKGGPNSAAPALKGVAAIADLFIKSQENLSSTRFIQDTATNWAPKAIFSRSKEDFAEMSFLEFLESAIFYFASPVLGEKLFRNKIFNKFQPKNLAKTINAQIPKSIEEISKNGTLSNEIKNRAVATKAGIVLACAAIPVAEYTLSFAKNLFTLKAFKKSNFNNIANLNKENGEKEDLAQQKRVEESSKKQFKRAAILSLTGVGAGCALAAFGHKSNVLQNLSKAILEPGQMVSKGLCKLGVNSEKTDHILKGFSLDFANDNGKLALSKGQLALTAILGLFGYSKAAEDRGKLDVYEVWTRVPLVVFYTIFGSELFEKGFAKILEKKNLFSDVVKKNTKGKLELPARAELPALAKEIAKSKSTDVTAELSRLTKEKAFVSAVPYVFSLLFMGLSLSAITRLWTQYRYNKQKKEDTTDETVNRAVSPYLTRKLPEVFAAFQ